MSLKTTIIIFILSLSLYSSTDSKPAIPASVQRVKVGAIQQHSYKSQQPMSNIEIDQALYTASTLMAKQLNIPIYNNKPENYNDYPVTDISNSNDYQKTTFPKKPLKKTTKSFSQIATSIKQTTHQKSKKTDSSIYSNYENN